MNNLNIILDVFKEWGIYHSFTDSDLEKIAEEILEKINQPLG